MATYDTIVRGGKLVTPDGVSVKDLGIAGGSIVAIGDLAGSSATEVHDATGLTVLPGAIDSQVHFREPGLTHKEDLESGTRAAIMGGVTTIFEMPNTNPMTTSPEALQDKLDRADGRAWCDYGFFVGATTENLADLIEYEQLPGSPGIKMFAGSSTGNLLVESESDQREVLKHGSRPVAIHSEDEPRLRDRKSQITPSGPADHFVIRDDIASKISTERLIRLCEETNRPIHILHISTAIELPLLRAAKDRGLPVTCEITPQHLWFSESDYGQLGTYLVMNPPIRTLADRDALRQALHDGLFDVIGSDHAPHTRAEKDQPYPKSPSGLPGVQTLVPAMLAMVQQGLLSIERFVQMSSTRPAELFGIANKGAIKEGNDADLIVLNPDEPFTPEPGWIQSKCGWTPYQSATLYGKPRDVFLRGFHAVQSGRLAIHGPKGRPVRYTWK